MKRYVIHDAKISGVTVYNTLNLFRGRGLIREVIVDPRRVSHDLNTELQQLYHVDTGEIPTSLLTRSR